MFKVLVIATFCPMVPVPSRSGLWLLVQGACWCRSLCAGVRLQHACYSEDRVWGRRERGEWEGVREGKHEKGRGQCKSLEQLLLLIRRENQRGEWKEKLNVFKLGEGLHWEGPAAITEWRMSGVFVALFLYLSGSSGVWPKIHEDAAELKGWIFLFHKVRNLLQQLGI